ncbi:MAG: acyltransferase [Betaproteobacteria bacterium]|nr:acyltransferase [Betaproteobacteria bacterium]
MGIPQHLSHPKYRADIDGLRAIAILAVLGFHVFPAWMHGGFIGVDIFFVISGFLISTIIFENLEAGHFSYAEFYARRIKRIFPALVLILGASFVLGWVLMPAKYFALAGKHMFSGATFTANFALLRETNYFNSTGETDPFHHLWSLAVEEQFYIVWPLLLGLVWRRRWNFLWITIGIALASFAFDIGNLGSDAAVAFYSPLSRFWELMLGGVLAYLQLHRPSVLSRNSRGMSVLGAALMVAGFVLISPRSNFPGWPALLPTAGTFLLIAAGPQGLINRQLLSRKPMVWVGLISYPLYLWHWPLLVFMRFYTLGDPTVIQGVAVMLVAMGLSWATYRFLEKPVRRRWPGKPVVALLLAFMVVFAIAGKATDKQQGFEQRSANAGLLRFHYDHLRGFRSGECFIESSGKVAPESVFKPECSGRTDGNERAPLVLLWGDSFAASLYRGLKHESELLGFDLAQYTSNGCPGIMGFEIDKRPGCKEINEFVFDQIKRLRPHTVIFGGNWTLYNRRLNNWTQLDFVKFRATVQALKKEGVSHIVIFGQLPTFKIDQPVVAGKVFLKDRVDRTTRSVNSLDFPVDEQMRQFARDNGVDFVSPMDVLCNAQGCLISTSPGELMPLAFDYGHLTESGSRLLLERALNENRLTLP